MEPANEFDLECSSNCFYIATCHNSLSFWPGYRLLIAQKRSPGSEGVWVKSQSSISLPSHSLGLTRKLADVSGMIQYDTIRYDTIRSYSINSYRIGSDRIGSRAHVRLHKRGVWTKWDSNYNFAAPCIMTNVWLNAKRANV